MVNSYKDARYNDGEAGWKNMVKELADANIKSLAARYEKGTTKENICQQWLNMSYETYIGIAGKYARAFAYEEPIVIIKYCQNYDYQSCEFDGYNDSRGYAFKEWILSRAISQLPGYDKADWGYYPKGGGK